MKFIVCDNCKDVFKLPHIDSPRTCNCGRIKGHYCDHGAQGVVYLRTLKGCRVVAIDTNLLYGKVATSESYVMDWDKSGLIIYLKGKPYKKNLPKDYVLHSARLFLGDGLDLLKKRYAVSPTKPIKTAINKVRTALDALPKGVSKLV